MRERNLIKSQTKKLGLNLNTFKEDKKTQVKCKKVNEKVPVTLIIYSNYYDL